MFAHVIFEECWPRWQQHFSPETKLRLAGVSLEALTDDADLRLSEMASRYLSADELTQWSRFSLKKRRTEWLGGRLSAKCAAAGSGDFFFRTACSAEYFGYDRSDHFLN